MENHNLILKISRLLSSSCHFTALPDVAHSSISISKTNTDTISHSSDFFKNPPKFNDVFVSKHASSDAGGWKCPPVTPAEPTREVKKFQERKKTNNHVCYSLQQSSSSNSGWFSSGDEKLSSSSCDSRGVISRCEEMKSKRSSRSSSDGFIHRVPAPDTTKTRRMPARKSAVKKTHDLESELGFVDMWSSLYYERRMSKPRRRTPTAMMEESLAVEKKSRDPRGDFRASMVDMILEKQLFGAEDLERLLRCFLNLNAVRFHGIIFEVFSEICQALFSY